MINQNNEQTVQKMHNAANQRQAEFAKNLEKSKNEAKLNARKNLDAHHAEKAQKDLAKQ